VQLVGSKSPQPVGAAKPVLTTGAKTLVTTSLSGVKLVNAVKAIATPDVTQQQTIFIKQQQQQQHTSKVSWTEAVACLQK
jgi:hypothetical protein